MKDKLKAWALALLGIAVWVVMALEIIGIDLL